MNETHTPEHNEGNTPPRKMGAGFGFGAGLRSKLAGIGNAPLRYTYTHEQLMESPDLPTLMNRLRGLDDDAGPKFGLEADGSTPKDANGKPRFYTLKESMERSIQREGGVFLNPMSIGDVMRSDMIVRQWMKHQQTKKDANLKIVPDDEPIMRVVRDEPDVIDMRGSQVEEDSSIRFRAGREKVSEHTAKNPRHIVEARLRKSAHHPDMEFDEKEQAFKPVAGFADRVAKDRADSTPGSRHTERVMHERQNRENTSPGEDHGFNGPG